LIYAYAYMPPECQEKLGTFVHKLSYTNDCRGLWAMGTGQNHISTPKTKSGAMVGGRFVGDRR
jgi:hypothetical protein